MSALLLVLLLLLIAINGFFVAGEFALVRSRRGQVEQLAEEGESGPQAAIEEHDTAEDLKQIIDSSKMGGTLDPGEAGMLGGVFHLHEQEAREVMTPIPAVVTVDASETVETALRRCVTSGHTRLVVIEDE